MKKILFVVGALVILVAALITYHLITPKIMRISDGTISFSFTLPNNWATETRHSGEHKPTTEEMRAYLSTGAIQVADELYANYCDQPLSRLKQLSANDIAKLFYRTPNDWLPYPTASVADAKQISYADTAWQQIDFYIFHNFNTLHNYFTQMRADTNFPGSTETINDQQFYVIHFPIDKDEKGREQITKNGTGGAIYYLPINVKDILVINKQAKGSPQFESGFFTLLNSLKTKDQKIR
jgi:hypothetical protein